MKQFRFAIALAIASPAGASQTALLSLDSIDVGRLKLGQVVNTLPSGVRKRQDCTDRKDPLSCTVLLDDGIWYVFVDRKVADKTIELPSKAVPSWIDLKASPSTAKVQLEKKIRRKFRMWTHDSGDVIVETDFSIRSKFGSYFKISLSFKKGRVNFISITTLPDPEV
ncbi:hypothetical protein [Novosphingobium ginsenosidimutans]|uniref:Uncharacterized protein n=1 Tax=Novosphingobium ginsenosidimutans TaxID=1176536 RepID=A0A5B8RYU6_9SPHN|nr:hypothetical protein [Novosphingobium ginsenosidimutans]QEA14719.1 hypothetical protein FRF71_00460 [Novosphingobium ginsenosidimutans]